MDDQDYLEPQDDDSEAGTYLSISDLMSALVLVLGLFVMVFLFQYNQAQEQLKEREKKAAITQADAEKLKLDADEAKKKAKALEAKNKRLKDKLDKIRAEQHIIIGELANQLRANDIDVVINPETGDVSIRENLLFTMGSAVIQPKGRTLLKKFLLTYARIVFGNPKYDAAISRVLVEGCASSDGTAIENMALSLRRAESVYRFAEFMPFDSPRHKQALLKKLLVSGSGELRATQGKIVTGERRVVFRFQFKQLDRLMSAFEEVYREEQPR